MKVTLFTQSPIFKGRREDRNTTNQLKQDNDYALTSNNQINITKAIKNLGKESGESNVKFLLDVADNLKYSTNIKNGKEPNNDWKAQLKNATESSLAISNPIVQQKYAKDVDRVFNKEKDLTDDEKDILKSQDYILSKVDKKQLDKQSNPNIKNLEKNLDYFVVSSEVPIKQKKYVMGRLAHFMSDEYKINPQLKDKKTQAVAEMVNDIVVTTKESKVPNTKAINQKHHGMCAAISIARKLMSYEDKPNYIDNVMSELDATPTLMVYDKAKIGEHKRVPVQKANVDFDDADKKGYRIVDASTTEWMHVADMYDADSSPKSVYTPFDRENFGVLNDTHFAKPMSDFTLEPKHKYYQSLLKAKSVIGDARKAKIQKEVSAKELRATHDSDLDYLQKSHELIASNLKKVVPTIENEDIHKTTTQLLKLESETSEDIGKVKDNSKQYHFIPNEEAVMKDKKVKAFLNDKFKNSVDKDALNDNASDIRQLIEDSNSTDKKINPKSTASKAVSKGRSLFEAAAAYRYQVVTGLKDKEYCADKMIKFNVPDSETLLSDNMAKNIDHINKKASPTYLAHFASNLEVKPEKKEVVESLSQMKEGVDSCLTAGLDACYSNIGMVDRKHALAYEVAATKDSIQSGDKDSLKSAAFALKMNPDKDKVLKEYNNFEKTLVNGADEKQYIEIFNKTGHKNQLQAFADSYTDVQNAIINPQDELDNELANRFKQANGLPAEATAQESIDKLNTTGTDFNNLSQTIAYVSELMDVKDAQGNIINSAKPEAAVISKMEKEEFVIPRKELEPLRDRFDKLDKLRSQDEFSSRQGKISDPTLNKFTKSEKETLNRIDKSLNQMYSETNKEFAYVKAEIQEPLEEHTRQIGVDSGKYWVPAEGESGLFTDQQTKIIQQMSDRPYHSTEDKEKAFDQIKNSPRSGISSSSVFHDKQGGHAQYVAEISATGPDGKDALYHDNSWGACELENTWVDSEGLTRTDYSDHRGGELGYITNEKYRNGNYTDNLMYKTGRIVSEAPTDKRLKKMSRDNNGQKFALMSDLIVSGEDGQVKRLAGSIKDNIFVPETAFIPSLDKVLSKMTQSEIKEGIERNKNAGESFKTKIEKIDERLEDKQFNKGINTEADYNSLADNDDIKVNFEKTALVRSFPDAADWQKLSKANTVDEVKSFEAERDKKAQGYFDYAFAKNDKILYAYALDKKNNEVFNIVNTALDKHNIKLDTKEKVSIIQNTAMYEKGEEDKFDGSLKNTIGFMVNKTLNQFDKVVPESDDAKLAKKDIKENLTKSLSKALYFNEEDVNNQSTKFKAISKYIDRKYNPETNEDFVNVYRNLQDMTTEEFKKETSDVTKADMGIKEYSGYDMLRRYKASDPKTESTFRNVVFQKELLKDIKLSETTPSYKYHKLYMQHQGDFYKGERTFDDIYRSFNSSMQSLDYEQTFKKQKDDAFRKYGVMPAYPKVPVADSKVIKAKTDAIDNMVDSVLKSVKTKKDTLNAYEMVDELGVNINSIPSETKATKEQVQSINNLAGSFITANYSDTTIPKSLNSANKILDLKENATGADYKRAYAGMKREFAALKQINSAEDLKASINEDSKAMKGAFNTIIKTDIPEKYQPKVKADVNEWISAELSATRKLNDSKKLDSAAEKAIVAHDKFAEDYSKYNLLNFPEEILAGYALLKAKDSPINSKDENVADGAKVDLQSKTGKLNAALEHASLVGMQDILMEAVSTGNAAAVSKNFKNYDLELADANSGSKLNMGDDKAVDYMVRNLVIGDNDSTAVMFINKLGVADKFLRAEDEIFNLKSAKKEVSKIVNIIGTTSAQVNVVKGELGNIVNDKSFDSSDNYAEKIDTAKNNIIEKTKRMTRQKEVRNYLQALDTAKAVIASNPNLSKSLIVSQLLQNVMNKAAESANVDIQKSQLNLNNINTIYTLISKINTIDNSEAQQLKQKYNDKYKELSDYQNSALAKSAQNTSALDVDVEND